MRLLLEKVGRRKEDEPIRREGAWWMGLVGGSWVYLGTQGCG